DSIARTTSVLLTALKEQVVAAGTLKDIHKLVADLAATSGQLQGLVRDQNRNFTETMAAFPSSATHTSNAIDSARTAAILHTIRVTSGNAARLVANFDTTNKRLERLIDAANNPNGTVGKLLGDSLLYTDARHTIASLDSLLTDFKANPRKYINLSIFGRK